VHLRARRVKQENTNMRWQPLRAKRPGQMMGDLTRPGRWSAASIPGAIREKSDMGIVHEALFRLAGRRGGSLSGNRPTAAPRKRNRHGLDRGVKPVSTPPPAALQSSTSSRCNVLWALTHHKAYSS